MIYIFDDGGEYSDHTIYFVESACPKDDVEKLLRKLDSAYYEEPHGSIVGAVREADWFEPGIVTLAELFDPDPEHKRLFQRPTHNWALSNATRYDYRQPKPEGYDEACRAYYGDMSARSKYSSPVDPPWEKFTCGNPGPAFDALTDATAKELISGWPRVKWADHQLARSEQRALAVRWFIEECSARGLL